MKKSFSIFVVTILFILVIFPVIMVLAQENQPSVKESSATESTTPAQPEEFSIYGEIVSVDQASNSIRAQYYDYDSDEERTINIMLDKNTSLENAKTLADIRQNDWADISYVVSDAKFVAKSIKVEKEEEVSPEEASGESEEILEE